MVCSVDFANSMPLNISTVDVPFTSHHDQSRLVQEELRVTLTKDQLIVEQLMDEISDSVTIEPGGYLG